MRTPLPLLALKADTIDDLVARALEEGHPVISEDALLEKLRREWRTYILAKLILSQVSDPSIPLPEQIPHSETQRDGTSYRVYGIAHDSRPSEPYLELVRKTCAPFVGLWEQGLPKFFSHDGGIEIPDHYAARHWPFSNIPICYRQGLRFGLALPIILPLLMLDVLNGGSLSSSMKREGLTPVEAMTLHWSSREFSPSFPLHLELELTERKKTTPYSQTQRRSGYQAEFLRAWNQQRTEYNGRDEPKNITVGAGHVEEILIFLKNGIKDQKTVDLAHRHAELLHTDPERFTALCERIKNREGLTNDFAYHAGILTPYALLAGSFIL